MQAAEFKILAINPGSSSTKFGVYGNERAEFVCEIRHSDQEMAQFQGKSILHQQEFRRSLIERELAVAGYRLDRMDAVAGRGGLLPPLASGTYEVNEAMLRELRAATRGEHASNLGAFLADEIARRAGVSAYVVDPVSVDERDERARFSGTAMVERPGMSHALNTKAIAKRYANEQGRSYEDLRLVVAHMGSGISVSAHRGGRMIDVNDPREEGPFSSERAGSVPVLRLVKLCFSGKYSEREVQELLFGAGGLFSYLGTKNLLEVERRIAAGDTCAASVFDAMAYQISKAIGAMGAALAGRVDAVLLTGGMARSAKLVCQLRAAVEWIAPVHVYPGEDELQTLVWGVLRVLRHEETARTFTTASIGTTSSIRSALVM